MASASTRTRPPRVSPLYPGSGLPRLIRWFGCRRHVIDLFVSIIGKDNTILNRGLTNNVQTLNDLASFMEMYDNRSRTLNDGIDSNEKAAAAILFVLGIEADSPHAFDKMEDIYAF